jgi:hypothetical protein
LLFAHQDDVITLEALRECSHITHQVAKFVEKQKKYPHDVMNLDEVSHSYPFDT